MEMLSKDKLIVNLRKSKESTFRMELFSVELLRTISLNKASTLIRMEILFYVK